MLKDRRIHSLVDIDTGYQKFYNSVSRLYRSVNKIVSIRPSTDMCHERSEVTSEGTSSTLVIDLI